VLLLIVGVGLAKGHPKSISTSLEKTAAHIFEAAEPISDAAITLPSYLVLAIFDGLVWRLLDHTNL